MECPNKHNIDFLLSADKSGSTDDSDNKPKMPYEEQIRLMNENQYNM